MIALLGLWDRPMSAWGVVDFLKLVIIIAGCIGIVWVVLQMCEIKIPPGFVKILWIVLACVAGLIAINIIASL